MITVLFLSCVMPPPPAAVVWGQNASMAVVCVSVCLSVSVSHLSWERKGHRKLKIGRKEAQTRVTLDPFRGWKVKHLPGGFYRHTACAFYRDVNVQWTISVRNVTSWAESSGWLFKSPLAWAGAYCVARTTCRTACHTLACRARYCFAISVRLSWPSHAAVLYSSLFQQTVAKKEQQTTQDTK